MHRTDVAAPSAELVSASPNPGQGDCDQPKGPQQRSRGDDRPIPVMLLISSLEQGGAERQVVELANNLDPRRFDVTVCSLSQHVPLAENLTDRAARLEIVKKRWQYDIGLVRRVARVMRRRGTQIVHAFLFDAVMVARLAAKLAGVPVVISSERNSEYRLSRLHKFCLRVTDRLHDAIIANSHAGKRFIMRTLGLSEDRVRVIHNGVDVAHFRPIDASDTRRSLGLAADQPVVGMVASFKPQKNHRMFLRVAQRVRERLPEARFVCVGEKLETEESGTFQPGARMRQTSNEYHRVISREIDEAGLREHCLFVGSRSDMVQMYNACDLTVLTSRHEGTPNVVLESLACGVPVVATDVADNARIIPQGRVGYVAALDDVDAMAERVCEILTDRPRRDAMGAAAREWVEREFSTESLARNTEAVYMQLAARKMRLGSRQTQDA